MNTKILREFQIVYERRSIHKAAKELFITPQGLGKNIRQLETELKTELFERTKQGMVPTASARLLYQRSGEIIRQMARIDNEIQQLQHRQDTLRIGCAYGVFNMVSLQMILDFISENPEINIMYSEYSNRMIRQKILEAELDYGIVVGREENSCFRQELIASCPVVVLVYEGHPFYEMSRISFRQLESGRLLSMNEDFWIYHEVVRRCRECGFEPVITAKSMDGIMLQKLCVQKLGIAIVPAVVTEEMNMAHLRAVPLEEEMNWEIYGMCSADTAEYDAIRKIGEFIRAK